MGCCFWDINGISYISGLVLWGKSTKKNHMVLTIEVGWGFRSRLSGHPILRVRLKVDTLNPASPPSIFVIQNGDHGISHHCHPTCPHVSHLKLPDVLTYSPKWKGLFVCSLGETYHENLWVTLDEFVASQSTTLRYTLVKRVLTLLGHVHTTPVQSY